MLYYNAFYQNKAYEFETKQVETLLRKFGCDVSKIMNFGCSAGIHAIELTKLGY